MNIEYAREQMVEQQVHAWEVFDERILSVMREVKRELFVPSHLSGMAFADAFLPIGEGQTMLPPNVHGRILQALDATPGDMALEIGAGTGYLTACLARLTARVRALEFFPALAEQARRNLHAASINNAGVEVADAMQLAEEARYDVIAVTGSLPVYDDRFQRALKPGGRLFVVVGQEPVMEAWKVTRIAEREWRREVLFETVIDPLVNAPTPPKFVF